MSNYGIYENESRDRQVSPSHFYQTIAGSISRIQLKSLDVSVGREANPDTHFFELTVDLHHTTGQGLSNGSTRSFKLKTPESIAGLMRDLDAKVFTELLGRWVLTHYDADQTPVFVAISHPGFDRKPTAF